MNALIIFAKYPEAGKVKTRLGKEISNDAAAELYEAMTSDLVDNMSKYKDHDIFIYYSPLESKKYFGKYRKDNISIHPQSGINLGERLTNAFLNVKDLGYKKLCVIGSDCLDIFDPDLRHYFGELDKKDVIIGPADDGGFYLLGVKNILTDLLKGIEWSTHKVFDQTIVNIKEFNLNYTVLNNKYDIDTIDELRQFLNEEHFNSELFPALSSAMEKYNLPECDPID